MADFAVESSELMSRLDMCVAVLVVASDVGARKRAGRVAACSTSMIFGCFAGN